MSAEENRLEGEDPDFDILPDGRYVMSAGYLKRRGYCCGNGCMNCPYKYENVPEPRRSKLLEQRRSYGED